MWDNRFAHSDQIRKMGADEFDYAKDRIWDLPRDISNEEKLELYKL
jgi:hypothetical protein